MKKILLTGSSGMLGSDIIQALIRSGDYAIFGFDINSNPYNTQYINENIFDITDLSKLRSAIDKIQPEIIIHTAAIVSLNVCEENPEKALNLHVNVSREIAKSTAKIVYISTDSIFNGVSGNYSEKDFPDPINNYSRTKYLGELAVLANNSESIIVRTNIFGFNMPLKGSIAEWGLQSFKNGQEINGFTDIFFNAIYTGHLGELIIELLKKEYSGIINIGSTNNISKYRFLKYLAEASGFQNAIIHETKSEGLTYSIPRPFNTTLNLNYSKDFLKLPTIYEGIDELVHDFKKCKENGRY